MILNFFAVIGMLATSFAIGMAFLAVCEQVQMGQPRWWLAIKGVCP